MRCARVCPATRCSRKLPKRRTAGSACRASSARHREPGADRRAGPCDASRRRSRPGGRSRMSTAIQIAADVRAGRRSARDVLEEHLARVDERESEIHAFNLVLADEARAAADAIDASDDKGPLAGVPIAIKDNMCTRGIPTTCSSRVLDGWRPPYDATVIERVR